MYRASFRPTVASIIWYNIAAMINAHYLFDTYDTGDQLCLLYNNVGTTHQKLLQEAAFPKEQIEHYASLFLDTIICEKNIRKIDRIALYITKRVHAEILEKSQDISLESFLRKYNSYGGIPNV